MKITINTDILCRHHLSLGEFLLMLAGFFDIDLGKCGNSLIKKMLAGKNVFTPTDIVLSNNSKDLVARILMESDDKAVRSSLDFEGLALELMNCYPEGLKPGTTHPWRGTVEEIAQKLRTLVVRHDFIFSPEEALHAVRSYLDGFEELGSDTLLLRSFILKADTRNHGMSSLFMTYIENSRTAEK